MDGVHACPDDYFRYTPAGLRRLATAAGLEVLWSYSPGSPATAAGELIGRGYTGIFRRQKKCCDLKNHRDS